jgi:CRISPR-associated protein Cas1
MVATILPLAIILLALTATADVATAQTMLWVRHMAGQDMKMEILFERQRPRERPTELRYAIVEAEARRAINAVGLDPCVGYLHELAGTKQPLVYDVQELYRWLADLSVIQLLEDHKLGKSAFITTENYHIRLREGTAQLLLNCIRNNFNTRATYKGKQHTYQTVLSDNVQLLANYLLDKQRELHFGVPDIQLKRNDDNATRDYILNMTPEQRKELGINKSTLWYIQKNLREGNKVKIYNKVRAKII